MQREVEAWLLESLDYYAEGREGDAQTPSLVVDLGCGPGHASRALQQRWPTAMALPQQARTPAQVVLYDGAGIGAAKAAFALNVLGFENVSLYEGGWSAWGSRLDLPVDR